MSDVERSVEAAIAELCAVFPAPLLAEAVVPSAASLSRVLAADVISSVNSPAFDNAAMDGYALRAADVAAPASLRVIGRALAGHDFGDEIFAGTCVRAMTGAPLPRGADAVVMQEDTCVEGDRVLIAVPVKPGANVRRCGEHVHKGDPVLRAGRVVSSADVGLVAAVGVSAVRVRQRLRVAVLSTGDELADPPAPLADAGSYDANRPLLLASLTRGGFETIDLGLCTDRADAFVASIDRAFESRADVLIVSGGAALGDADVVRKSGADFLPLNIRPGRGIAHAGFERNGRRLVLIGLPGNAVAAYVMFHLVASPLLRHLSGALPAVPARFEVPLAVPVSHRGGRIDWMRARLIESDRRLMVAPLAQQGSGMLRTVTDADALIAIGPQASYSAGEPVATIPLSTLP